MKPPPCPWAAMHGKADATVTSYPCVGRLASGLRKPPKAKTQ